MSGTATAVVVAAVWVALTATTGKTYHLAPPLIAAAPGAVGWSRAAAPLPSGRLVAACGLAATALGWLAIAAGHIEPEATLFAAQPGGVLGETALGALVGAAAGAWLLKRATKRVIGPAARKR